MLLLEPAVGHHESVPAALGQTMLNMHMTLVSLYKIVGLALT